MSDSSGRLCKAIFIDPDDAILCIFVFGSASDLSRDLHLHIFLFLSDLQMDMDSFMHNSSLQSRAKHPLPARTLRF